MVESIEQATIDPIFPLAVYDAHMDALEELGVSMTVVGKAEDKVYLYIKDGCWDWDSLASELQFMIAEAGLPFAMVNVSISTNSMRNGLGRDVGGMAWFITPDCIESTSTYDWLGRRALAVEVEMGYTVL